MSLIIYKVVLCIQDNKTVEIVSTCYISLSDDDDNDDDDDDKNNHPSLLQVNLRFVKTG
jgi:hypothetical protein